MRTENRLRAALVLLSVLCLSLGLAVTSTVAQDFPGFAEAVAESGFVRFAACPVTEMGYWDEKGYAIWCGRTPIAGTGEFKESWERFSGAGKTIEHESGSKWTQLEAGPVRNHFWFGELPGFVLYNPANKQILLGLYRGVLECEGEGPPGSSLMKGVQWVVNSKKRRDPAKITPPKRTHRVYPAYPQYAPESWAGGVVQFQVVVDTEGIPRQICVVKAEPDLRDFRAAAADAVRQWRYKPAMQGGKPIPVFLKAYVQFSRGRPRFGDQFRRSRAWP